VFAVGESLLGLISVGAVAGDNLVYVTASGDRQTQQALSWVLVRRPHLASARDMPSWLEITMYAQLRILFLSIHLPAVTAVARTGHRLRPQFPWGRGAREGRGFAMLRV
jgi:hypothetical protein